MRIAAVEATPLNLRHIPEHRASFTTYKHITNILVTITTDDGLVGLGEGALIPQHLGEDQPTALALVNERFRDVLIGLDPYDIRHAHALMRRVVAEGRGAKSAVDFALHDLAAQRMGVPLYTLLGGLVRETYTTASGVGFGTPAQMVAELQTKAAAGFTSFEVKMSGDADADLERCLVLAREVDPALHLILDPNEGWTVTETIDIGRRLSEFSNRFYFEQPVPKENVSGMAQARRFMRVPIIAHEPITSAAYAYEIIRAEAADIINVTPARLGSLVASRQVIEICEAAGLDYRIDTPIVSKIGETAVAHLGAACDHVLAAVSTHLDVAEGPDVVGGMTVEAGIVSLPTTPGIGVSVAPNVAK